MMLLEVKHKRRDGVLFLIEQILTNAITTRVRMGQHVQTLSGDISARVYKALMENFVVKVT